MTTRTYRALLVGNSTFPNDSSLIELEGPRNDLALLRDALCDPSAGLVPTDNIRIVPERTMSEALRELEGFLAAGSRDDILILYYTGHGVLSVKNELYLCTRDTDTKYLKSTAVKASDVREMVDESAAGTTVIFLDCCHSGRFKGGDLSATLSGRGSFVVTSSRPGELANDTDVQNRASLFTHHLVEGLLRGAEDHDGDGMITLSDVYDYVHGRLADIGRQVPQKRFEGDGHVALAQRAHAAAQQHDELLDPAMEDPILDIPVQRLDLGDIEFDTSLPPERVAIVNRGGGALNWTFESASDWIDAQRDGNELVLRLHPERGRHIGNVFVREMSTGVVKTVRVSVNVVDRSHELADDEPTKSGTGSPLTPPPQDPPNRASQGPNLPPESVSYAADWYPDPMGRFDHRFWDGARWTDQVSRSGRESHDPLEETAPSSSEATNRYWGAKSLRFFVAGALFAVIAINLFSEADLASDVGDSDSADAYIGWGVIFAIAAVVFFIIAGNRRKKYARKREGSR